MPGRPGGMMASLRGNTQSQPVAGPAAPIQQQEMNEPVEESALRRTWKQYIQTIPEEKLLQTAMQNSEIQLLEGIHIGVTVFSDEQMKRLNENKGPVLSYLRQQLRNTKLELSLAVKKGAEVRLAFTPRERLAEMREKNPEVIDRLIETFGLELS